MSNQSPPEQCFAELIDVAQEIYDLSKRAAKAKQSLVTDNRYGHLFHDLEILFTKQAVQLKTHLKKFPDIERRQFEAASATLIRGQGVKPPERLSAIKTLRRTWIENLHQIIEDESIPEAATQQLVISEDVVKNTPGYFRKLATQINGCYEKKWYDAASVMMRKIVESLIIDVYIKRNETSKVTGTDGNFYMLERLIGIVLNDAKISLNRESKASLPAIKLIGDRAAHSRHYVTVRKDIDDIKVGFRVVVDDLLHQAGHK